MVDRRQINNAPARPTPKEQHARHRIGAVGHLMLIALAQFLNERVVDRRRIEPGRAERLRKTSPPSASSAAASGVGDRAFLGQQRTSAELEGDRTQLGLSIQCSHSCSHHTPPAMMIGCRPAQRCASPGAAPARADRDLPAWSGLRCWTGRCGHQPTRILIHHAAEQLRRLAVGALPQRAESREEDTIG